MVAAAVVVGEGEEEEEELSRTHCSDRHLNPFWQNSCLERSWKAVKVKDFEVEISSQENKNNVNVKIW